MAKLRKKKLSTIGKVLLFYFIPCFILYIFTSIFLRSANNSLAVNIQEKKAQIEQLKIENNQLTIDIQGLQNKDRIYTIAEDSGLTQNQDNIINIKGTEGNEAK